MLSWVVAVYLTACSVRDAELILQSVIYPTVEWTGECARPTDGLWRDRLAGGWITQAELADVVRVVPLAWAIRSRPWSGQALDRFASDRELWWVTRKQEAARRAGRGLSVPGGTPRCEYLQAWIRTARRYQLNFTIDEARVLSNTQAACERKYWWRLFSWLNRWGDTSADEIVDPGAS